MNENEVQTVSEDVSKTFDTEKQNQSLFQSIAGQFKKIKRPSFFTFQNVLIGLFFIGFLSILFNAFMLYKVLTLHQDIEQKKELADIMKAKSLQWGKAKAIPILAYKQIDDKKIELDLEEKVEEKKSVDQIVEDERRKLEEEKQKALDKNIDLQIFMEQIKYLYDSGYKTITLKDLQLFITGHKELPANSIMITFDDGDESSFKYAYPILKEYSYTGVVFVPHEMIGKTYMERKREFHVVSWSQIIEMNDVFEVGSQTSEIVSSKTVLDKNVASAFEAKMSEYIQENRYLMDVDYFAYPFGEYNEIIANALKTNRFKMGFTLQDKKASPNMDLFYIPRILISNQLSMMDFQKIIKPTSTH